jgi:SAM-dependent methyltransferase
VDYLNHNRNAWNAGGEALARWSTPVDHDVIRRARAGDWRIFLTPRLPVPGEWLQAVRGRDVLCLASGGGQQAPVLAAAGAKVVSFDLSDAQLAKDRLVAEREGLAIACVQGDMADLASLRDATFDLIVHPASNVFVSDVTAVWRECSRVLRSGGELLAGFMNPAVFLFDHDEADASGVLAVKYRLPYSDLDDLDRTRLAEKLGRDEPLEFSHSLDSQIGGQIAAGFAITGFYEDRWVDDSWPFANHSPIAIATRARKER